MPCLSTDSFLHRRVTGLLIVVLACLWPWLGASAAGTYNLPALGQPASTTLSPVQERRIGARFFSHMLRAGRIVEDAELRQYIQQLGERLVQFTSESPDEFRFFVVKSSAINAFALPGGFIGINAGLILKTETESELASVLAHEISHVTQRHIARQIAATKGTKWVTLAALLGAAIASGGDGDAIQAAITGSISIRRQQQISYTRAHELEADRIGIRLLAKAHFDPRAMAHFFETMQRHARLYGDHLPQILLTHPVNNTRIAEARARAADYPSPNVVESAAYAIMKERTRVLTNTQRSNLLAHYRSRGAPDNTADAQDYGYALALTHVGQAKRAIQILQRVSQGSPGQVHYVLALARAQAQAGQTKTALNTLEQALSRFASSPALKLTYATILVHSGQLSAAGAFLHTHPSLTQHSYQAQALLARIAGSQGKLGEAYYRQALYRRLRGAYIPAIRKLRGALRRPNLAQLDQYRLEALLDQVIAQCKRAWPQDGCTRRFLHKQRQ